MIKKDILCWVVTGCIFLCLPQVSAQQGPGLSTSAAKQQGLNRGLEALYRTLQNKNRENNEVLNTYSSIEGSAYFEEEFRKGTVYYNGEIMGSPYLRYDAHADEIQIKKTLLPEESYGALLKSSALWCVIGNHKVTYRSLKTAKGEVLTGYVQTLVSSGKYLLFVRKAKIYQEGREAPTSLTAAIKSKFIDDVDYYFGTTSSEQAIEMGKKKKELVQLFDEADRAAIKSFIKKKLLKLNEESDLITLFYYANSL
jgi:hypothetical protein